MFGEFHSRKHPSPDRNECVSMHDEDVKKGVLVLDTIFFPKNVNEVEKG